MMVLVPRSQSTLSLSLNNDCKLVHGNVCLATVVVTPTLDWKLHAFDVLSEFDGSKWTYAGCLIYELFSGSKLGKTEELRNTTGIPKVRLNMWI
uniref:Protein kinase domain-containing protein n=1 Tax=Brassica oleracea TaxID=3712 RepID=A0A3P6C3L9_BRAOL|nr:unnamed protein product [Brassica oleracea]